MLSEGAFQEEAIRMCMCSMVLCFCCDMASTVIDDAHAQGVSERSELTPSGHLSHPMCSCTAVRVCVCVCVCW